MCGGYYEEELEEMTGPKWRFNDPVEMQRAVNICKKNVPADSWRVIDEHTIAFASIKAEELYSIAKAVAGSGNSSQAGRSER